jgi:hypothetical protein
MPDPSTPQRGMHRGGRRYGAVRTVIIGYGVAVLGYLHSSIAPSGAAQALGGFASSRALLLAGLAVQLLLMAAHALVKRHAAGAASVAKGMETVELAGDAVTVLLFALGTLGAIAQLGQEL